MVTLKCNVIARDKISSQKDNLQTQEAFYREASLIQDFLYILFKRVNKGATWTRDEKKQLKLHLIHLSGYIPILIIFLLPGGSLLLPLFAEVLDRRKKKREKTVKSSSAGTCLNI